MGLPMLVEDATWLLVGARVAPDALEPRQLQNGRPRDRREIVEQVERYLDGIASEQTVEQARGAG